MIKVLVTGANGQLARCIKDCYDNSVINFSNFQFDFKTKEELDISNIDEIEKYLDFNKIDYIVNCAAYTNVAKAELVQNMDEVIEGNVTGPLNLAILCSKKHINLIHISTDYVFSGSYSTIKTEDMETCPLNQYGRTKKKGETEILKNCIFKNAMIIRTSWLYSKYGNNFVKTIYNKMLNHEHAPLSVVYDQIGTPTFAPDLATFICHVITSGNFNEGIYHYSNEGVASWYDFAVAIRDIGGFFTEINPVITTDNSVERPKFTVMSKDKIKAKYPSINIPYWRHSLKVCIDQLKQQSTQ